MKLFESFKIASLKGLLIIILLPIVLVLIIFLLAFTLCLSPFLTIGYLIYKYFEFIDIKNLRKMKLEYKLKNRF